MDAKPKKDQKPQKTQPKKIDWGNDLRHLGDHIMVAGLELYFIPAELGRRKFNDREVLSGLFLSHSNIVVRDGRTSSLRAFAEYEAAREAVAALEKAASISGADLTAAIQVQQTKLAEAGQRLDQAINTPGAVDLWKHVIGENGYLIVEVGDPELNVDPVLSVRGCEVNLSIVPGNDKWALGTVRYAGDNVPGHTHFALDQAGDSRLVQFVAVCGKLKGQEIKEKISLLISLRRGKFDTPGLVSRHLEVRNADGYLAISVDRTYMALPTEDLDLVQRFLAGHVAPEKPAIMPKTDQHLAAPTLGEAMAKQGITPEAFADPVADTPEDVPEALPADEPNPVTDEAEQAEPANDEGPSDLPAAVERGKKPVTARQAAAGVKPRVKRASGGGRGKSKPGKGDNE